MFSVLKKLAWFFKLEWKRYTIAIVLLIIVGIFDVMPPKLVGIAIDEIYAQSLTKERLVELVGTLAVVALLSYGLTYIWLRKLFGGSFVLERTMRSKLMRHFTKMTPTFFEKNRTGDLMARATNDLNAISQTSGFGILTLVDSSIFMVTILAMMVFTVSWELTLAALLPMPLMALAINVYGRSLHERFMKAQDAFGDMNDRVLESIAGVRVVRAFVQERQEEQLFHQLADDVVAKNIAVAKIDSLFDPTIKLLVGLSHMISLGYGSYLVFQQQLTLGNLIAFNVYLGMLVWPMFAIGQLINIMQRGNASLDRVDGTLSYKQDVVNPAQPAYVETPNVIDFEEVTFQYPSSKVANLQDVSFTVRRGETLGIVGKTGAGKTTIVRQLLREYPAGTGAITFNGVPLTQLTKENVLDWLGYVPQDHILFSKTVEENLMFARPTATKEEMWHAIEAAVFKDDLERLPEGLNTLVGEKGIALSGGQKQRLSIARALLKNPEVLLLDDALSAVDAKTEAKIIENIRRERHGKTTMIVTHRLSAVEHADWIIVLDEGKIIQEGTHEQLVAKEGWYNEQFIRQQLEDARDETEEVGA